MLEVVAVLGPVCILTEPQRSISKCRLTDGLDRNGGGHQSSLREQGPEGQKLGGVLGPSHSTSAILAEKNHPLLLVKLYFPNFVDLPKSLLETTSISEGLAPWRTFTRKKKCEKNFVLLALKTHPKGRDAYVPVFTETLHL